MAAQRVEVVLVSAGRGGGGEGRRAAAISRAIVQCRVRVEGAQAPLVLEQRALAVQCNVESPYK